MARKTTGIKGQEQIQQNQREASFKDLEIQALRDSVTHLKYALGILISLGLVIVSYNVFRSEKEYEKALNEVSESVDEIKELKSEAQRALDRLVMEGQQMVVKIKDMRYETVQLIEKGKEELLTIQNESDLYKLKLTD